MLSFKSFFSNYSDCFWGRIGPRSGCQAQPGKAPRSREGRWPWICKVHVVNDALIFVFIQPDTFPISKVILMACLPRCCRSDMCFLTQILCTFPHPISHFKNASSTILTLVCHFVHHQSDGSQGHQFIFLDMDSLYIYLNTFTPPLFSNMPNLQYLDTRAGH